ncbi:hypothetical protein EZJ43_16465 [Pedobacter changchengzhani]|uniref:Uncharacterized protein n=1 Tax=Pedobacter changchengzhani TaxID=2529274 RepID=A0A4R5MH44_9SPHI|nr:hypothetical protein [Pedobacter changchengzhani]TDG34840.1 hypothetical protein EZJ43_16465 [Pedobacter changchengzhani]
MNIKFKLFFITFLSAQVAFAQLSNNQIATLKVNMVKAVEDSKLTDSLFLELSKLNHKSPLILGYIGTLEALKAKHAWNPYNKIKYVSRSLVTLQKAINLDGENMEIRFMRFSIEHFTPSFLGFSKDLDVDRKEIIKHYQNKNFGSANEELIKNIAKFMVDSNRCTAEELRILKKYL